jgi:hypothetical protein
MEDGPSSKPILLDDSHVLDLRSVTVDAQDVLDEQAAVFEDEHRQLPSLRAAP